jgi:signal transduction histidine kinase
VRQRRTQLEREFIQIATYAMIYVGVAMNVMTSVVVALGVWAAEMFPVLFLAVHIIGTVATFGPAWVLVRRGRARWAIWAMLLVGTIMLFAQMWILRDPSVLALLPVVSVLPTLVLPWRWMLLYLTAVVVVFWGLVLSIPGWTGAIFDWWTIMWLFALLGLAFIVVGAKIQHVWDRFAKESVGHEQHAAEHARLLVEAQHAEELAVERERNRFTREFHDRLGSAFTSIGVRAQVGLQALREDKQVSIGEARAALLNIQQLADTGVERLRQAIRNLRDDGIIQCSLPDLIQRELDQSNGDRTGFVAQLECTEPFPALRPYVAEGLLRIVQEALTNVQRHAQATAVTVYLQLQDEASLVLTIEDNGTGCDPERMTAGFGLQGMRERVEGMGGTMQLWTAPGQGFQIVVEVPL